MEHVPPPHDAALRRGNVQGQERILRERFARIECVQCGAHHRPDDMLVLAQRASRWLLLLTCWRCQRRGIFVASFPPTSSHQRTSDVSEPPPAVYSASTPPPDWLLPASTARVTDTPGIVTPYPSLSPTDGPVTSIDVDSMRRFLEGFNGDFRTLFGPSEGLSRG